MKYAIVIPAFNEAGTIRDIAQRALQHSKHVIVIDDGSTDGTLEQVADLPIALVRNVTNQGKAASLWRGMQRALTIEVDAVVTLDADGQHAPEDIAQLIESAKRAPNRIVIGVRMGGTESAPAIRYYANRFANFWISWACGYRLNDSQSGFRVYPASLLRKVDVRCDKRHSFVFESEILIEAARMGCCASEVKIPRVYQTNSRPSHFRQVDSLRITGMVAKKLVSRWLYLQGFYRAFLRAPD